MKRSSGPRRRAEAWLQAIGCTAFGLALILGITTAVAGQAPGPTDSAVVWIYLDPAAARTEAPPVPTAAVLAHRTRLGIGPLEGDRPLPPELLARLEAAGARIRHVSRWLRAVSAWVDPASMRRIAAMPEVSAIRPVGRSFPLGSQSTPPSPAEESAPLMPFRADRPPPVSERWVPTAPFLDESDYGRSLRPLEQLGVVRAHGLGYTGKGIRIALLDTGFRPDHVAFQGHSVVARWNFVDGDTVVTDRVGGIPGGADHGTAVWSLVGGYLPGTLLGPAFEAEYILAKVDLFGAQPTEDEDRWVAGLEWAVDSMGAQVVVSARGFRFFDDGVSYRPDQLDGATAASTRAAEEAARRGVSVVAMVGNLGPGSRTLVAPADGPSVIAVGAVDVDNQVLSFSSAGPTADGRIKPDVVAPGSGLTVASATSSAALRTMVGSDAAAALMGGVVALFRQAWPDADALLVRKALTLAGSNSATPGGAVGYGIPDLISAIVFPEGVELQPLIDAAPNGTLRNLAPQFAWAVPRIHPMAGQVTYRLELSEDPSFTRVFYTDSVVDGYSLQLKAAFRAVPEFWWRVVARTEDGLERVTTVDGPYSIPSWVQLNSLNPTNGIGVYIEIERPELRFSAVAASPPVGPLSYVVQVISAQDGRVVQEVETAAPAVVTVPEPLPYNQPYLWRVIARSPLGVADTVTSLAPFVVTSRTRPPATQLYQNFPNPFPQPGLDAEGTRIWFDLQTQSVVELAVYDLRGRLVRRLIPGPGCGRVTLGPGLYGREGAEGDGRCVLTRWDGRDENGRIVPRGIYLLRLRAGGVEQTRRMVFLPPGS